MTRIAPVLDTKQALEKLRQFLITHELPKTDVALFGVQCPYCGKSDRIRELEPPEDLTDIIDPEKIKLYTTLWKLLGQPKTVLGVCKFCLNPLELILDENKARTLSS
jgi:hypothetical protein